MKCISQAVNRTFVLTLSLLFFSTQATAVEMKRISLGIGGAQANGESVKPSVTPDGRYVAFVSNASNLVANDTNNHTDYFVLDRQTDSIERISVASDGSQGTTTDPINDTTYGPIISADGRYVVFLSKLSNLVPNDTGNSRNLFLHDRNTGTTTKIDDVEDEGVFQIGAYSGFDFTPNGRYFIFASSVSIPGQIVRNRVYIRDLQEGTTAIGPDIGFNTLKAVSDDGRYLVISAQSGDLGTFTLLLYDRSSNSYVSLPSEVSQDSQQGVISPDNRFLASDNAIYDIVNDSVEEAIGNKAASFSSDGRYVSYGHNHVSIYDRVNQSSSVVSFGEDGSLGNGSSRESQIVTDGKYVIFSSSSNNLVSNDTNGVDDIFITWLGAADRSDFDGNGKSEILWRNTVTGQNLMQTSHGHSIAASTPVSQIPDTNWKIQSTKDFNGDKRSDVLWRNTTTGVNWIWLMESSRVETSSRLPPVTNLNWIVAGTGDMDGDGKTDILWRDTVTGLNWIWLMDGQTVKASQRMAVVGPDWVVAGMGDFDGDGKSDVFWRELTTHLYGGSWVWLMDGATVHTSSPISTVAAHWRIVGIGDLDGDDRDDIVYRHFGTGANWVWLMNDDLLQSTGLANNPWSYSRSIASVNDLNWEIVSLADFNRDRRSDIMYRNKVTGQNWLWLMDGFDIIKSASFGSGSTDWKVAGTE